MALQLKRKAGDSYQYSTTVVYVLSPASIQDRKTVNVRHILVAPETNDKNTKAKDATDAQWAAAYKKATKILDEFNAGDKKEKSFSKLAEENSTDTGSKDNGGLYENVVPGQMVNSFSAWCFDSSRKAGDTAIVKSISVIILCTLLVQVNLLLGSTQLKLHLLRLTAQAQLKNSKKIIQSK